jgi:general secretion pathway protein C
MVQGSQADIYNEISAMKSLDSSSLQQLGNEGLSTVLTRLRNPVVNRRLALVAKIVLIIALAFSAARITWQLFTPAIDYRSGGITSASSSSARTTKNTLDSVAELHLFGEAAPESAPAAEIKAPETRLRLVLNGVFASDIQATSMAIISEKGKKEETYFKGDKLPGNAKLHEIYADKVILNRAGKLETLTLKRPEATIESSAQNTSATTPTPAPGQPRTIGQVREQLSTNPLEVLKDTRLRPVNDPKSGQLLGYTLSYTDARLPSSLGLRPDDIITQVNGVPVTNQKEMISLMQKAGTMTSVNLSVLRDGTPQTLTISLD